MAHSSGAAMAIMAVIISGCSFSNNSPSWFSVAKAGKNEVSFLDSGSISISRPVPQLDSEPARVMAFMPVLPKIPELANADTTDRRLSVLINLESKTIRVNRGSENLVESEMVSSEGLVRGDFVVTLKQTSPVWYAPEDYFLMRGQEAPEDGSSERYRKGALGSHAIFLSDGVIIHSSPIPDPLINGLQIPGDKIASIYSILEPGMRVTVQ